MCLTMQKNCVVYLNMFTQFLLFYLSSGVNCSLYSINLKSSRTKLSINPRIATSGYLDKMTVREVSGSR